ncbi:hypothetical protein EYR36_007232 [Pleurotus pulmonarius]|nr:hypothetical protein EYR36_007232 [Pleurotus pulmonarius]
MNAPSLSSQRRRSSAAHTRPAAPPPNHPIPSIPSQPSSPPRAHPTMPDSPERAHNMQNYANGVSGGYPSTSYPRPSASANLVAVASFSSRQPSASVSSSQSPQLSASSSLENLTDPPPPSSLPSSRRSPEVSSHAYNDNYLLTPPEPRSARESKPSSRRTLMKALELAREAVELDSTNDDPIAAVKAYGRSVALLSEHDTYADRMNILSLIYSIPPMPHSVAAFDDSMSASTGSTTQSPSPTSTSPTSETTQASSFNPPEGYEIEYHTGHDRDRADSFGSVTTSVDTSSNQTTPIAHPYATHTDYDVVSPTTAPPSSHSSPSRTVGRRSRSGSTSLPPPVPPPSTLPPPPPAPGPNSTDPYPETSLQGGKTRLDIRQRGESIGHRRTGSGGRLGPLQEENERVDEQDYRKSLLLDTPKTARRESHPLPPLPATDADTPTAYDQGPPSPRPSANVNRQRGVSQPVRSESAASLINVSTSQGTIHQRRSKPSTASTPRSSSPSGSTASVGSLPPSKSTILSRPATSSLPSLAPVQVTTRSRALSQPDRRMNGRASPDPPPIPVSAGVSGPFPRQLSFSSKHPGHPPPLTVQTDIPMSAGLPTAASLVPPPHSITGTLPTTPPSPLPPIAPSESLRKPFYMMHLLMTTMSSPTGGYITRRLHVPQEVWTQGGVKLANVAEKIRVVEILCSSLEELQITSADSFGAGNVSSGMALGIGSIGRKEGEAWIGKLEEFSLCCDNVVANFGKKLGVGEGFVVKKTTGVSTWGNKISRRFGGFTNGKNLDSPAAYVQGLKQLFQHVQLLDEHAKAVLSQPVAPSYAALPSDLRSAAEAKLRRSSEFFASVILTFVIRDLAQLLDKYAKRCEKWLEE